MIQSLNEAVSQAKQRTGTRKVVLVGYSGGGGATVLMAAQRQDVSFLGTVAGNIDHAGWTTWHALTPLNESMNPLDVIPKVRSLRQRHLSSTRDSIIPPEISQKYCKAAGIPQACIVVDGPRHGGAWEKVWDYDYNK